MSLWRLYTRKKNKDFFDTITQNEARLELSSVDCQATSCKS